MGPNYQWLPVKWSQLSKGIENRTDILTKYYFRINRKESDYKLFSKNFAIAENTEIKR